MGNLEYPLGPGEVGQAMVAQIQEVDAGREVVSGETGGGLRAEHLAAPAQGQEAGGSIEGRPEVIVSARLGGAGMDGHANPQGYRRSPLLLDKGALAVQRCRQRGRGRGEGGAQAVAGVGEDPALGLFHGAPHDLVVTGQVFGHCLLVALPATRAGLDVREEEHHRVARAGRPRGPCCSSHRSLLLW